MKKAPKAATKNINSQMIDRLKKKEAALETAKTKTPKESKLEKVISKATGKKYIGKR